MNTCKQVLLQTVKALLKRCIMQYLSGSAVFGKIKQIFITEMHHNLEIFTCDPLKYKLIISFSVWHHLHLIKTFKTTIENLGVVEGSDKPVHP